jgi:hypothetical protein
MSYDVIGGGQLDDYNFMTIGELIEVCKKHPSNVVKFLGTGYTVDKLSSWRGSYDTPSVSYTVEDKTGLEIANELTDSLKQVHCGYKGGDYRYTKGEEFYVAQYGSSAEYKVVSATLEDDILVLYTKLDPY